MTEPSAAARDNSDWRARLDAMEDWYRDLLDKGGETTEAALAHEYAPYARTLGRLRGRVLDVGGGAGLAARHLHPSCEYVVLDPAEVWTEPGWAEFAAGFRGAGPEPTFVTGSGENMPFPTSSFDCTLSLWSLNHASNPARCAREIVRVLRTSGFALFVLEDIEPRWRDIARMATERLLRRAGRRPEFPISWHQPDVARVKASVMRKLSRRPWPLQEDHIRIMEADLMDWLRPELRLRSRSWSGGFLSLSFERS